MTRIGKLLEVMDKDSIDNQVDALVSYMDKSSRANMVSAAREWLHTKDFHPEDKRKIAIAYAHKVGASSKYPSAQEIFGEH